MSELKNVTVKLKIELNTDAYGNAFKKAYFSSSELDGVISIEGTINFPTEIFADKIEERVFDLIKSFSTDEISIQPDVIRMSTITSSKEIFFSSQVILDYIEKEIIVFNREKELCTVLMDPETSQISIDVPEKYADKVKIFLDGITFSTNTYEAE